jgi:hypothetical protein
LLALEDRAKSITRLIRDLPLIIASGLLGRRVEPALAGTIMTK